MNVYYITGKFFENPRVQLIIASYEKHNFMYYDTKLLICCKRYIIRIFGCMDNVRKSSDILNSIKKKS